MKSFFGARLGLSEGSGTILGLGMCLVSLTGLLASNLAGFVLFSGQKLQAQADEIAISAADSARGLITGYPCQTADQIAHIYMVSLDSCRIVGFESFIRLRSVAAGFELMATSRAGPAENN